jgi:hypothetical protein
MFTDASNFGWGAHVNEVDLSTKGTWSQEESKMSINILEFEAVLLGVKHFLTQFKNQRLSPFSDNSTVVAYIRKQGGTHSPVLCRMTWELLQSSREYSPRPQAYTGEAQHTGRCTFQIEQASLHRVDTTHGHCPNFTTNCFCHEKGFVHHLNHACMQAILRYTFFWQEIHPRFSTSLTRPSDIITMGWSFYRGSTVDM